jgi:hypothetical protein
MLIVPALEPTLILLALLTFHTKWPSMQSNSCLAYSCVIMDG